MSRKSPRGSIKCANTRAVAAAVAAAEDVVAEEAATLERAMFVAHKEEEAAVAEVATVAVDMAEAAMVAAEAMEVVAATAAGKSSLDRVLAGVGTSSLLDVYSPTSLTFLFSLFQCIEFEIGKESSILLEQLLLTVSAKVYSLTEPSFFL